MEIKTSQRIPFRMQGALTGGGLGEATQGTDSNGLAGGGAAARRPSREVPRLVVYVGRLKCLMDRWIDLQIPIGIDGWTRWTRWTMDDSSRIYECMGTYLGTQWESFHTYYRLTYLGKWT